MIVVRLGSCICIVICDLWFVQIQDELISNHFRLCLLCTGKTDIGYLAWLNKCSPIKCESWA